MYVIGNPGGGELGTHHAVVRGHRRLSPRRKPCVRYDALELTYSRRFSNGLVRERQLHAQPAVRQLRRTGELGRNHHADDRRRVRPRPSSRAAAFARQGGNANRAWDIDEVLFTSHGATIRKARASRPEGQTTVRHRRRLGRLATDRPHVVKLYGSYTFPFGTQIGANFYGGSGTPISTYVVTLNGTNLSSMAAATWVGRRC